MSKENETVEVTEEVVETTTETTETKTLDEIKAEAEALERENKELKEKSQKEEEYQNQQRRLEKAREKNEALKQTTQPTDTKVETLDVEDLMALREHKIPKDSEKAELLKSFIKSGLIKSVDEGMTDVAVIAKFREIDERNNVKTVIDENNQEEYQKTKKEIVDSYRRTGEAPSDPKTQKLIAEENLKAMGL